MADVIDEPFSVYLEVGSTPDAVSATRQLFDDIGFATDVEASWPVPERGLDAWSIIVAVPSLLFFKAFIDKAGERAADAVADFLGRLSMARSGEVHIEIGEPTNGPIVIVQMGGGDFESFGSLELALQSAPNGAEIRYDVERKVWQVSS